MANDTSLCAHASYTVLGCYKMQAGWDLRVSDIFSEGFTKTLDKGCLFSVNGTLKYRP